MKRIAALTMVRNDDFFLHKWIDYYGRELGRENLYVFFDGLDQHIPGFCAGTNTLAVEKIGNTRAGSDKGRINFMSAKAAELLNSDYDLIIGGDADEYLVVDPLRGESLSRYLENLNIKTSVSGLGLDVGQKLGEEGKLSLDRPFLSQRHFARIGTRYTKASVIASPVKWGSGFHRVEGHDFHIAEDLYLFHFGYSDISIIESRLKDGSRLAQGWEKHVKKRSLTTRLVSSLKAREFAPAVKLARKIETLCRPPYAWNKPALLGMKIIVKIPERFRDVM